MQVDLSYGKKGLSVKIPDVNLVNVLTMKQQLPLSDPAMAIVKALQNPIGLHTDISGIARGKKSACIIIPDMTRPMPNNVILPPLLRILKEAGIEKNNIIILIATGTHRPNLGEELVELVGREIVENYRVENHYAHDFASHANLGASPTGSGIEILIDKRYVEAELKIATGFIEPHFMAGYSGGRKSIAPGIAAIETTKRLHSPELMGHVNSREDMLDGNPFHNEVLQIAKKVGVDMIINVALNEQKQITGVFCGDLDLAHRKGVEFVRQSVKDTVPEPVDVVITTGGGYPLDATWYQTIKGVHAALPVVKKGGTIIVASECSEGIGSQQFAQLIQKYRDLEKFLQDISGNDFFVMDQWQLQKYAIARRKANVILVSDSLSPQLKDSMNMPWQNTVETAIVSVLQEYRTGATIAAIPKGPYVLVDVA